MSIEFNNDNTKTKLTKARKKEFNKEKTKIKIENDISNNRKRVILLPKNKNNFLFFFNITDLRKIVLYFVIKCIKDDNNELLANKFKKGKHFIVKKGRPYKVLKKKLNLEKLQQENEESLSQLDNDIFNTLISYEENEEKKSSDIKDKIINSKIEEINIRKDFDKNIIETIQLLIRKSNFSDPIYENRKFEVDFYLFLKQNLNQEKKIINLSDVLNNLGTSKNIFKENILSSNLDLNDDPILNKESHYYYLHLWDYSTKFKEYYFLKYHKLFCIKINKAIGKDFLTNSNDNFSEELNLSDDDFFIPIFNKSFNPAFNRIPSNLKYNFTLDNKNNIKSSNDFEFSLGEHTSKISFIDKGVVYKNEESEKYNKFKQENSTIEREYTKFNDIDVIKLSIKEIPKIQVGMFKNLFSSKIEIFGFENKKFVIKNQFKNSVKLSKIKNKYTGGEFVYESGIDSITLIIPVSNLLENFWKSMYEININKVE